MKTAFLLALVASALSVEAFVVGSSPLVCDRARQASMSPQMLFGGGGGKDEKGGKDGGMNMGNMMESLKKANEIGQKTKALQEELEKTTIEGVSTNGKVKVFVTGQQMPAGCEIDEAFMGEGREALQESVTEAMANAHKESLVLMSKKLGDLYQEMGLPIGGPGGPK